MKNITIILPNLRGGGAEKLNINLANYFINEGYSVTIVTINSKNDYKDILNEKINIINLESSRFIFSIPSLIKFFITNKPSFTLVSMWPLTCVAVISWFLAGKKGKLYLSEHNMLSIATKKELRVPSSILWFSITLTYNLSNKVIAVSKGVKNDLEKIALLKKNIVKVIYNPVSFTYNKLYHSNEKLLWKKDTKYKLLNVGSLIKQKDHRNLIKAINIISKDIKVELIIIGEGLLYDELIHLINKLNLEKKISILPFKLDLKQWYESSDLFILSSQWEGFGNVIVEAFERGTPVVSTDCQSGPSEIITSREYGLLVPIKNPQLLSEAILKSLNKRYNKNLLIEKSKNFSVKKIGKQYLELFNE